MAKSCIECGRSYLNSNRRSHSNIATKIKQRVNLQQRTLLGKRGYFCTRCIKTLTQKNRERG